MPWQEGGIEPGTLGGRRRKGCLGPSWLPAGHPGPQENPPHPAQWDLSVISSGYNRIPSQVVPPYQRGTPDVEQPEKGCPLPEPSHGRGPGF